MRNPTRVIGNATLATSLVVSTVPCKLYTISGVNNNAAQRYIQVHNKAALPVNGTVPIFSFPVGTGQYFSFDISFQGADLDAVTLANSTVVDALTLGSADCAFQAIIAG